RLAAGRASARLVQAQQGEAERRLAGPRFADDAERVAGAQLEGRAPHRLELLAAEDAASDPGALGDVGRVDHDACAGVLPLRDAGTAASGDVVVDDEQARR